MVAGVPVVTTSACGYAHYVADWQLGRVLAEPTAAALAAELAAVLAAPPEQWRERARRFAGQADIFAMPERAAAAIEQIGRQRRGGAA
jgi:UDP-glucose:(heptosyl)LPS alpha-1,3-glucosyltransferase